MRVYGKRTDFSGRPVTGDSFAVDLPDNAPEGACAVRVTVHASRGAAGLAQVVVPFLPTVFLAPGIPDGAPYPTGEWVQLPEQSVGRSLHLFLPVTTAEENAAGWTWQGSALVEFALP